MATYYSGSTKRRDVMPNLYLKEHVLYPESSVPGGMPYLNNSSSGPCSETLPGSTQSQDNCIEIPTPTTIISQDPSVVGSTNAYNASQLGQHAYHAWMDGRSEMLLMQTIGGSINRSENLLHSSVINDPQMGLRSHLGILHGQKLSMEQSNVSPMQGQGLSLSLGTQVPVSSYQYQPGDTKISFSSHYQTSLENGESYAEDYLRSKNVNMNSTPYGLPNPTSSISNSKYLKAAQQLLDEVVNVRKALKQKEDKKEGLNASSGKAGFKDNDGGSKSDGVASKPQESTSNDLSPSERQDLQNKVTKLLAMLDEVDRRYKQYYHQMQIVVSSFDAIAGSGAAKPYTALALQTISRHFRCLRDAITSQIRATRKSLGEQESSSGKGIGISRLRYIDQQIRQQRAMQQFGMMQPHAWRPQRGLPESAVTILRAWLFEHFLHPYPKDSEKLMLARQTGLSRGQVSNWFINARVRLWKPMIEEMYKEESGDVEIDSNSSSENPPNVRDEIRSSEDREDVQQSPPAEMCQTSQFSDSLKPNRTCNMDIGVTATSFQAQPNGDNAYMGLKVSEQKPTGEDCSILQEALSHQPDGGGRFFAYEMGELGRYGNSGAVSLTLGLQNCDNGSLPVSNGQQSFISMRGDIYGVVPPTSLVPEDYEYMNLGDGRHRFGSSSQLMHDFVA